MNVFSLSSAELGKKVKLVNISGPDFKGDRLKRMGFVKGAEIIPLYKSIGGDPCAYYVKGLVLALRKSDAQNMLVCSAEEWK